MHRFRGWLRTERIQSGGAVVVQYYKQSSSLALLLTLTLDLATLFEMDETSLLQNVTLLSQDATMQ
jgi:hypothetical protein